jgi:hypothetical protein
MSLLLEHGIPPAHPPGTLATGVSVVEVEMDGRTGAVAEGVVILVARINTEGIVIGVEKISGDAALFEQSQLALKSWKPTLSFSSYDQPEL